MIACPYSNTDLMIFRDLSFSLLEDLGHPNVLHRDSYLGLFDPGLVSHRELMSSFGSSIGQNLTAAFRTHALTETVFVGSSTTRRLKSLFHD